MEFLATAAFGLEGIVKNELRRMGFDAKAENGGARFQGSPEDAFRANLCLRTADRVLLIAGEGKAVTFEELFQLVKSLPWEVYLPRSARFPVNGKCARSQLMSVRDCQAIVKKAIVERLKSKYKTSWFEENGPEYPVDVSVHSDFVRLTLDTSGTALNKRGYRTWNGEAPLRETLAAALVALSPLREDQPLCDPCCGTGTLLIEGAYSRAHRAPGLARSFACEKWPLFPEKQLKLIREETAAAYDPSQIGEILGSDIDPEAISLCRKHIRQAGLNGKITVNQTDLKALTLRSEKPFFLLNPPYGERIGDKKSCERLYGDLRDLYDRHPGCGMGVITAHTGFERCFGMRAKQKRRLYNGRLECEFMIF